MMKPVDAASCPMKSQRESPCVVPERHWARTWRPMVISSTAAEHHPINSVSTGRRTLPARRAMRRDASQCRVLLTLRAERDAGEDGAYGHAACAGFGGRLAYHQRASLRAANFQPIRETRPARIPPAASSLRGPALRGRRRRSKNLPTRMPTPTASTTVEGRANLSRNNWSLSRTDWRSTATDSSVRTRDACSRASAR